jgi:ATP-dependent DNA helicase DinG
MSSIAEVFAPQGALSEHFSGFTHRSGQQLMAELIWESFATRRHAVIEAGTGIGKTFAYLVPVMLAGRRAIVSTGTKTLQDQLMDKDLPALGAAIGRPVDVAVLKGRNNYLCWHRLELARADRDIVRQSRDLVEALAVWGRSHVSGDLSELQDLDSEHSLRARVTSSVDNCLGAQCEHFERCFVAAARRRAHDATIVVVNHHLLLADLALKESGFGDLLGNAATVIVDEAHLLPEIAQQFFGVAASTREIESVLRDAHAELRGAAVNEAELTELAELGKRVIDIRRFTQSAPGRKPWREISPRLLAAFVEARDAETALADRLAAISALPPGLVRCRERLQDHVRRLALVLDEDAADEGLRWLEVGRQSAALHRTPFETGDALCASIEAQGGVWIFASATLAVGDDFSHFIGRIGIEDPATAVIPSPFDYARQARIYVPEGLADPGTPDHTVSLLRHVWPLVEASDGGAFLLFTSHRALQEARAWIELRSAPGPVLVLQATPYCSARAVFGTAWTCAARRCASLSSTSCLSQRQTTRMSKRA